MNIANNKTLSSLHQIGEVGTYPCGCKFKKVTYGFNHYVNNECEFDSHKIGRSYREYRYLEMKQLEGSNNE